MRLKLKATIEKKPKKKRETFEEAVERGYKESKEVHEQYLKDKEKKQK